MVSFTQNAVTMRDDSPLQGRGVTPDVEMQTTAAQVASQVDGVLEHAASMLLKE